MEYRVERKLARLQSGETGDPRLQQSVTPIPLEQALLLTRTPAAAASPEKPAAALPAVEKPAVEKPEDTPAAGESP